MLKPRDVYVICQLVLTGPRWSYRNLAAALGVSTSVAYEAVQRGNKLGLLHGRRVEPDTLCAFLEDAAFYVLYQERGEWTSGWRTGWGAFQKWPQRLRLRDRLVWPDPQGLDEGQAFEPLHPAAAAVGDPINNQRRLHELLALVDLFRDPGTSLDERQLAVVRLRARLLEATYD